MVLIVALAAAAVMGTLMERMSFLCTLLVVLSAMVALYGVWLYVIQPGRIYDKNPALGRQVSFLFNREDLSRQDEETAVLLDWDLKMLWRSKEFYYLFRGAEALGRQVSFLFNREDLSRQDEETAVLLDWDLKMLWRSKEFYYLFRGAEGYLLLPRSAFQSEEDRLRFEFLAQTACPEAKVKRFD